MWESGGVYAVVMESAGDVRVFTIIPHGGGYKVTDG